MSKAVNAIIEMPAGTNLKFEIKEGKLILDRALKIAVPYAYGFIPKTLGYDNDPLDIFVISLFELPSNCQVSAEIMGVLEVTDNGEKDHKIIAVLDGDPITPKLVKAEVKLITKYLQQYKKGIKVGKFKEASAAFKLIDKCGKRFRQGPLLDVQPNMWKEVP